jgi:predicted transcriptional regulator
MDAHALALPPGVIYRNMRFHHNVTFSYSSIDNYLDEFVADGLVRRVEPASLETREPVDLPADDTKKGYYIITDKGRDEVNS